MIFGFRGDVVCESVKELRFAQSKRPTSALIVRSASPTRTADQQNCCNDKDQCLGVDCVVKRCVRVSPCSTHPLRNQNLQWSGLDLLVLPRGVIENGVTPIRSF